MNLAFIFTKGERSTWVLKLQQNGDVAWQKIYSGGEEDYAEAVQQTRDNGYIIAGWTYSFGTGGRNIWMLKLDEQGDIAGQELFETRQAFADDYLLVTAPCSTMTGASKKITFTVNPQKRLNIYVSGPPGCHYMFSESCTRKIWELLIKALDQFEKHKKAPGPIVQELGRFKNNEQTLKIVYRKDQFGNSSISLSLVNMDRHKAGDTQSLIVVPEEIQKIIEALNHQNNI